MKRTTISQAIDTVMTRCHPRRAWIGKASGLAAGAAVCLLGPASAAADEPQVIPDKDVTLEISGRVNQAVLFADNDRTDKTFIVDNDNSASRIGLEGEANMGDWKTGTEFVIGLEVNTTDEIKFTDVDAGDQDQFGEGDLGDVRQAHWWISSPGFGYLSIGQGDEADEDASEVDLSGTTCCIAQSDVDDTAGGLEFAIPAFDAVDPENDDDEVDDFFSNLDGGRDSRVFYQTPSFGGLALRGSLTQEDDFLPALGATYGGSFGESEFEAAIGYRSPEDDSDTLHGSFSVMTPTGINFTFATGTQDSDASEDPNFFYGKLGYKTSNITSAGSTRFSIDFFQGRNNDTFASPGGDLPEATSIGAGVVQKVDALSTEFYFGIRNYSVEDVYVEGARVDDPEDIITVMGGARVRF